MSGFSPPAQLYGPPLLQPTSPRETGFSPVLVSPSPFSLHITEPVHLLWEVYPVHHQTQLDASLARCFLGPKEDHCALSFRTALTEAGQNSLCASLEPLNWHGRDNRPSHTRGYCEHPKTLGTHPWHGCPGSHCPGTLTLQVRCSQQCSASHKAQFQPPMALPQQLRSGGTLKSQSGLAPP